MTCVFSRILTILVPIPRTVHGCGWLPPALFREDVPEVSVSQSEPVRQGPSPVPERLIPQNQQLHAPIGRDNAVTFRRLVDENSDTEERGCVGHLGLSSPFNSGHISLSSASQSSILQSVSGPLQHLGLERAGP
ncbi:hypothetical protein Salat_1900400 [Sesamum alatum]|uniref:Uncharacterized protein n=1 Tax=Sesamum alatum TaxID=300844 RepID=A0AAE1Y3L1_9LAMI|nr:hypothetical protein Salat_1900400 [Sesamum alatum]